jgi:hypothetical protein
MSVGAPHEHGGDGGAVLGPLHLVDDELRDGPYDRTGGGRQHTQSAEAGTVLREPVRGRVAMGSTVSGMHICPVVMTEERSIPRLVVGAPRMMGAVGIVQTPEGRREEDSARECERGESLYAGPPPCQNLTPPSGGI